MSEQSDSKRWLVGPAVVLLVAAIGFGYYMLQREADIEEPVPVVTTPVEPDVPPPAPSAPPRAAVARPESPAPVLPALDASDPDFRGGLVELFGAPAVEQFLAPEKLIRNIVVTIDNVPRAKISLEQRPIQPTPGEFVTAGTEDEPLLAPENYLRYEAFIAQAERIDARTLVALYRSLEPLFQQAYEELGYPEASFEARLIEVIDHLGEAPMPSAPIRLARPGLLFVHADEQVESLSAGHKLLIRMGPDNAAVIKRKSREIRAELIRTR